MSAPNQDKMLIILTTGAADRGARATLAFSLGVSALISGLDATIYMTMDGTFWSRESSARGVRIDGFDALPVYVSQFVEAGGKLMVCSPCNEFYCSVAQGQPLLEGAELCGLTTIVDLSLGASVVSL
jgi:predicted peroxiredoxin